MITKNPFIIAEAAQGYEGNPEIAKLLLTAAAKANADAVKFQIIYADDIAVPNYQYYNFFKSLEMSLDDWRSIRALATDLNIEFYADISGPKSADLGSKLSLDGAKIHSTCFYETPLFDWCLTQEFPLLISIGGIEIPEAIKKLSQYPKDKFIIMHGYQAEPTPTGKNVLNRIPLLRHKFGTEVGFMDHSDGEGPDTLSISAMALAIGVRIFEKHITLDRALKLEDHISALTPTMFSKYVKSLHRLTEALGKDSENLGAEETLYKEKALKRVLAARKINKGKTLSKEDVKLLRPAENGGAYDPRLIIGKTINRSVDVNQPIDERDIL